ncbi:MAG: iron-sulfur cluster co-chaperone HscB C-terminal domain-containing protein [Phycisphaerae bacterium]
MIAEPFSIEEATTKMSANIARCAVCDANRTSSLYCPACATLTIPQRGASTYFEILGLPITHAVDSADVAKRHLELARAIHPDRMARTEFAADAVRAAALLNEAKATLESPTARAEYLLQLHGGPRSDENKTVPPELLGETLELREQIDDARAADDLESLATIRKDVLVAAEANLSVIHNLALELPGDESIRYQLRVGLNAQRYYDRLIEYADGKREM